jgi:hypothetical protein
VIVAYDGLMTLGILKALSLVVPLRMAEGEEELGDSVIHGERVQPLEHEHPAFRRAIEAMAEAHLAARAQGSAKDAAAEA